MTLSHLNARGEASMVDVGDKAETRREATATGAIFMAPATLSLLVDGRLPKGDVLATARIAGIQAAKRTHELIPLCHQLALSKVAVDFEIDGPAGCVRVSATCRLTGRTGVEMEALTAVSVACLTLYDMCKAVDKDMTIAEVCLAAKTGGKSGDYRRQSLADAGPIVTASAGETPIVTSPGVAGELTLGLCSQGAPSVRVKCLAELRERLGIGETTVALDRLPSADVAGLKTALKAIDERFQGLDQGRVLCAVNQVMAGDSTRLTSEDEVAFFPPVTGG